MAPRIEMISKARRMARGIDRGLDFIPRKRGRLFSKSFSQTIPGALALALSALFGVWILYLRPAAAPYAVEAPAAAPAVALASNPYGGLFDLRSSSGSTPVSLAKNFLLELNLKPVPPAPSAAIAEPGHVLPALAGAQFGESAPLPVPRLTELGSLESHSPYAAPEDGVLGNARSLTSSPPPRYDRWTAVYDVAAHTVYLPNGTRLEAHSGLHDRLDDPRHVNERMRGATPPNVYELAPREQLFHGVQALRLKPVGGGDVYGRTGLLAHTYMLGPNGDSNGCVSFRDYNAFLQAYQNGEVKRLVVVARLN